jgi:hypothetical protein
MPTTKNKILSDIELRLTKGKPSDDHNVVRRQLSYLVDIERDLLVSERLKRTLEKSKYGNVDPFYISSDLCLKPSKLSDLCADCPGKYRYAIELTRDVISLNRDAGLVRVVDNYGKNVTISSETRIKIARNLPFSKPSKSNQVLYRENRYLIIEGLDEFAVDYFTYDAFYVPKAEGQNVGDDDNYPIEDELIGELTNRVIASALRQQIQGVGDVENDGTDPSQIGQ